MQIDTSDITPGQLRRVVRWPAHLAGRIYLVLEPHDADGRDARLPHCWLVVTGDGRIRKRRCSAIRRDELLGDAPAGSA